jgi:hypothetical protein
MIGMKMGQEHFVTSAGLMSNRARAVSELRPASNSNLFGSGHDECADTEPLRVDRRPPAVRAE